MRSYIALPIVALASLLLIAHSAPSQDTKEFTPKNEMYTLTFPADGKVSQVTKVFTMDAGGSKPGGSTKTKNKKTAAGPYKLPVEGMQSIIGETSFVGASIGIPAVLVRDIPAEKRFEVFQRVIVKTLNGKVTKDKDINQGAIPGKEYEIELPKGAARMQLYTVAGWVIYALAVSPDAAAVNGQQADQFFGRSN
jgi:outer membrane protein assembly factor BamE (lipoprotein component of BamABCDE complex)